MTRGNSLTNNSWLRSVLGVALCIGGLCAIDEGHAVAEDGAQGQRLTGRGQCNGEFLPSATRNQGLWTPQGNEQTCLSPHQACVSQAAFGIGSSSKLFINFDGPMMSSGGNDNATQNITYWSNLAGQWSRISYYDNQANRDALVLGVREIYEPFGIEVVGQRPASGAYTMIVIGHHPNLTNQGGYATFDCGDDNPNSVGFVSEQTGPWLVAHEAGHTFGLSHVITANSDYIMNPTVYDNAVWTEDCTNTQVNGNYCDANLAHCPNGQQDSEEMLCTLFDCEGDSSPADAGTNGGTDAGQEHRDAGQSDQDDAGGNSNGDAGAVGSDAGEDTSSEEGGCSVGGEGSTSLWLFLILIVVRRRRRS